MCVFFHSCVDVFIVKYLIFIDLCFGLISVFTIKKRNMKILVPTDFSNASARALDAAIKMSYKVPNSEIHVVHVYEKPYISNIDPAAGAPTEVYVDTKENQKIVDQLKSNMQDFLKDRHFTTTKFKYHILPDVNLAELDKDGHVPKCDLIVVGTSEHSSFWNILFPSDSSKIIRGAGIPILTVGPHTEHLSYDRVLFCSEFSSNSLLGYFQLKKIVEYLNLEIQFLKIITAEDVSEEEERLKIIDKLRLTGLKDPKVHVVYSNTVKDGIKQFVNIHHFDIIATETHGTIGFSKLFGEEVTESLAQTSSQAVLNVNV